MQLSSENTGVVSGMIKVVSPDLIIVSLVGMYDIHKAIFDTLILECPDVPVLTIGTKEEWHHFLKFYENQQFENLIRPIENSKIYEAACRKLYKDGTPTEEGKIESRKKILVVDDNGPTLRTIKGMLDDVYDVTIVPSGMKAMTSIGKSRPDLILLDYEMPVCDGRQTLEMIRADDELNTIPVIFLTGVSDRAHIEPILKLKPAGYLLKPPIKEKLLEAIDNVLEKN